MPIATGPTVEATDRHPTEVTTDVLIVPSWEQDDFADLPWIGGGDVARAVGAREFTGRLYDVYVLPLANASASRVALVGAGKRSGLTAELVRRVATAAALFLRPRRIQRAAFVVRGIDAAAGAQAGIEGLIHADFSNALYRSGDDTGESLREIQVVCPGASEAAVREAVERGRIIGESCNISRGLANEPGNRLTPTIFAERAARIGSEAGLTVEVLDEREIEARRMGLLLGIARGSAEPPRVIILRHEPAGAPGRPVLGLVGKGITFDTGGISIKPAEGMDRMKDDMAGGAAVLTAMRAMSILGAPMRVVGVIPSTENMPGGRAVKPGDVLVAANGTTVEVNNTDAEGRLILGDGLWLAQQLGATHLVDVATLTGACMVALGRVASGLFGTPDSWREHVQKVALSAGDRCWPLPLFDDYLEQLKSEIADLVNSGGRPAGAITAAMFLKEFTGGLPWAHLDIAGTAWADDAKPYQPKGPTAAAVRTLAALAFTTFPD
jgi:leucyl aminopeptidase